MIVDWATNCEQIFLTKSLSIQDPSESKSKNKQEFIYIKYLHDVMQLNRERCFEEWKLLDNGIASKVSTDRVLLESQFNRVYNRALRTQYNKIQYQKKLNPIIIFQEEVDFLNSLNVPMWVRQYWACLLYYYKFEIQNTARVQKSPTLNAWCIRHTDIKTKRYGSVCQDAIAKYHKALGFEVISDFLRYGKDRYPSYKPAFLAESGTPAFVGISIKNLDDFLKLIQMPQRKCISCGAMFAIPSGSDRQLCDACYSDSLKEQRFARDVAHGQGQTFNKSCVVCGRLFVASNQTQRNLCDECYREEQAKKQHQFYANRTATQTVPYSFIKQCRMCGKNFEASSKSKRDLCDTCYLAYRHEYQVEKKREYRDSSKQSDSSVG